MLRIPEPGEKTAPLVAPIRRINFAKDDAKERPAKHQPKGSRSSLGKTFRILKVIGLVLAVICIIAVVAFYLHRSLDGEIESVPTESLEVQDDFDKLITPSEGED
ncbi:MAG: hypothetical protein ACSHX7_07445 [Luteolibacter sp.]